MTGGLHLSAASSLWVSEPGPLWHHSQFVESEDQTDAVRERWKEAAGGGGPLAICAVCTSVCNKDYEIWGMFERVHFHAHNTHARTRACARVSRSCHIHPCPVLHLTKQRKSRAMVCIVEILVKIRARVNGSHFRVARRLELYEQRRMVLRSHT